MRGRLLCGFGLASYALLPRGSAGCTAAHKLLEHAGIPVEAASTIYNPT